MHGWMQQLLSDVIGCHFIIHLSTTAKHKHESLEHLISMYGNIIADCYMFEFPVYFFTAQIIIHAEWIAVYTQTHLSTVILGRIR